MKKKLNNLRKRSYYALALSAALAVIGCIVFVFEVNHLIDQHRKYEEAALLIETLDSTLHDMQDMESGQKEYLLTGKQKHLEPFNRASYLLNTHLIALENAVYRSAPQDKDMTLRLREYATAKREELTVAIRLRDEGNLDKALTIVNSEQDAMFMAHSRELINDYSERYRAVQAGLEEAMIARLSGAIGIFFLWVGSIAGLIAVAFSRIRSAQKQLNRVAEQLNIDATHDTLTGLPNRRYLNDWLQHAIARGKRMNESVSALYIDLDGFSDVNNTYGHDMGDLALKWAGKMLKNCLRESDFLARLGGDEFIVITCAQSVEQLQKLAERLTNALLSSSPFENIPRGALGASIGIAVAPLHSSSHDQLVSKADQAMYEAKRAGKRGYRIAVV